MVTLDKTKKQVVREVVTGITLKLNLKQAIMVRLALGKIGYTSGKLRDEIEAVYAEMGAALGLDWNSSAKVFSEDVPENRGLALCPEAEKNLEDYISKKFQ